MKKNFLLSLGLLIVFGANLYSKKPDTKVLLADARAEFFGGNYGYAALLFEKLDSLESDKTKYDYLLGVCYLHQHKNLQAQQHLLNASKRKDTPIQVFYFLGKADHYNSNFDGAIADFTFYKDTLKKVQATGRKLNDEQLHTHHLKTPQEVDREIDQCKFAKDAVLHPDRQIVVTNAGEPLNSKYAEYTSVFTNNEDIMFVNSRRPEGAGGLAQDADYFEDIYVSYKAGKSWSAPANIAEKNNENLASKFHDAVVSLSNDEQSMIMYRASDDKNNTGDLYYCKLRDDEWSSPVAFSSEINTPFSETHANYADNGNTLYFTSDKPGGKGEMDIYISRKDSRGKWGKAENLGDVINTPYNEESPYVTADGKTLYFSSEGHLGMGGFDIYSSQYDEITKTWSKPVNLGVPINSPDHDMYLQWSLNGQVGYFTSMRPDTKGDKDIYRIERKAKLLPYVTVRGHVLDAEKNYPIGKAELRITDLADSKEIVIISDSATGEYRFNAKRNNKYAYFGEAIEHFFYKDTITTPADSELVEFKKDLLMLPFKLNQHVVLKNIFFDFNKSDIRPESEKELLILYDMLRLNPSLKLEIGGHTDSIGKDDANLKLSQERCNSVVAYLIKKGIKDVQLTAKGYGETVPVAPNKTDQGRQLNRRTEFTITDIKFSDKKYVAITDEATALQGMKNNKANYLDSKADETPAVGHRLSETLHFPHSEHKIITDYSKRKADHIVEILNKYASVEIEIIAHSDEEELKKHKTISAERAKLVYDYLVSKGINAARLKYRAATLEEEKSEENDRRVTFGVTKN